MNASHNARCAPFNRQPVSSALELLDPLVLPGHTLLQALDLLIHPQQQRHDRISPLVIPVKRRQVCWSHVQRDFAMHADGLRGRKATR